MTKHPIAIAIALAFAASTALSGCDSTSNFTEQEHIQRAKDYEDKGNLKGGIVELKNALQKNPESAQARLLLGQLYLKSGKGAEAEKELTLAEKLGVNRESIKLQLGEALLIMGETQRVLDEINPGEQTSKANLARILQLRASALLMQGKLKDACNLFQQSYDTDNSHPPTYWGLAQCSVADRDMTKAREWLDRALKITEKQAKTWIFIGDLERLNNNTQAALAAYANALKSEPENLEAIQNHATLSMSLGQLDSAKQDIEKARKLAPNSIGTHYLQASYSFHQKKYPEARDSLNEVFKITPDHLPSVLLAGATYFTLGSYQQAETQLNRFLAIYPGHAYARRLLAATSIKQNQPDSALKTLAPILSPESKDAAAFALAGEAYLMKRDALKGAAFFEKASKLDPDNASIHTQLGLSRMITGNPDLAITQLEAAVSLSASEHNADTALVLALLKNKEYDKALAAIGNLEKKLPQSPITHNLRGRAYLGKKDIPKARLSFEQALVIESTYFPAAASLAQLDMADKKPESARKRFEDLLEKDKNNLDVMLALAQFAAMSQKDQESVDWLEKAAKAHPKALQPRLKLGGYYLSKNQNQKALALAREALDANPASLDAMNLMGTAQLAAGEKDNALITFTRLAEAAPQSPMALLKLAQMQQYMGKNDLARTTLKKALQVKPDFEPALDAMMVLEVSAGRIDEALRIARQIQSTQPRSPQGFIREGDILLSAKRHGEAAKAYEKALALGRTSGNMMKWHQAASAGDGKTADARLVQWLKEKPDDNQVRIYLAETYASTGRHKEAIEQYEEIRRRAPNNAQVINNLASLYLLSKDQRALATAEQAYKLAPDHPAVQDTLGWILVEQGQVARGLDLLRKAIGKAPDVATLRYHYAVALARNGNKAEARKELERLVRTSRNYPEEAAAKALLATLSSAPR